MTEPDRTTSRYPAPRFALSIVIPVYNGASSIAELVGALIRNWDANQTPAVRRHKIDRLGRDFFRGHDQIAFVLAIRIVGHDHHAPFRDVA